MAKILTILPFISETKLLITNLLGINLIMIEINQYFITLTLTIKIL